MIWNLRGNLTQNALVTQALKACDFPFERLLPSLQKEGKTKINVTWRDLSRMGAALLKTAKAGGHLHVHDGDAQASPVIRKLGGRQRVLGLFYLPPYTEVVLDPILVKYPTLAKEVFLSEAAHAVDYHYMTNQHRINFWNAIHGSTQDLAPGTTVHESGNLHHDHSWFDGAGGYNTWVGEAFMEGFVKSFAPSIPVTIRLTHPVSQTAAAETRQSLLGTPTISPTQTTKVFVARGSRAYHKSHKGIAQVKWYDSEALAQAAGYKPCSACVPK